MLLGHKFRKDWLIGRGLIRAATFGADLEQTGLKGIKYKDGNLLLDFDTIRCNIESFCATKVQCDEQWTYDDCLTALMHCITVTYQQLMGVDARIIDKLWHFLNRTVNLKQYPRYIIHLQMLRYSENPKLGLGLLEQAKNLAIQSIKHDYKYDDCGKELYNIVFKLESHLSTYWHIFNEYIEKSMNKSMYYQSIDTIYTHALPLLLKSQQRFDITEYKLESIRLLVELYKLYFIIHDNIKQYRKQINHNGLKLINILLCTHFKLHKSYTSDVNKNNDNIEQLYHRKSQKIIIRNLAVLLMHATHVYLEMGVKYINKAQICIIRLMQMNATKTVYMPDWELQQAATALSHVCYIVGDYKQMNKIKKKHGLTQHFNKEQSMVSRYKKVKQHRERNSKKNHNVCRKHENLICDMFRRVDGKFRLVLNMAEFKQCNWTKCRKKDTVLKKCKKCESVMYCSKICQKKDWKQRHKRLCLPKK